MKHKLQKLTGEILRTVKIEVDKKTKVIKVEYYESPVLLSTEKEFVVEGRHKSFEIYNRKKEKYSSNLTAGTAHAGEQKWHSDYFNDYVYSYSTSFQSKNINARKAKKALIAYLQKEYGFYADYIGIVNGGLDEKLKEI